MRKKSWKQVAAIVICAALLSGCTGENGQKKNTQPNILFILCDDMGYGDLGCYGCKYLLLE
mgnify:FL=1